MTFNSKKCEIKKIYCGEGILDKNIYSRQGSTYECLKKGYGIASWEQRKKDLPIDSLEQIPYVGPLYTKNFNTAGIKSIPQLISKCKKLDKDGIKKLLYKCCSKNNNVVDNRATNSILLLLFKNGIKDLPNCVNIK
jgi:hypothetical protein